MTARFFESVLQDLRHGLRLMRRNPGFVLVAVVVLGLGIGANAAIFGMVNGLLLRPLPVEDPGRLVALRPVGTGAEDNDRFSYPDLADLRAGTADAFTGLVGRRFVHAALGDERAADVVWGELVTGNFFSLLGVAPAIGRGFLPEEDRAPGEKPVIVLGHRFWQERYRGDAGILGRPVRLNGHIFTVVGVAPPVFTGTQFALGMDFWVPVMMHEVVDPDSAGMLEDRRWRSLQVLGRLAPGVTSEGARRAVATVGDRLARDYPEADAGRSASVVPEFDARTPPQVSAGLKLGAALGLAIAALILLIACANVANLLLARAAARRREVGVRLSLGAPRLRLVRQLLTEGFLLAVLGGGLGVLLATWTSDLLARFRPPIPFRLALDYAPDGRVLLFTAAVSALTVFLFGLAPALQASRGDLVRLLNDRPIGRGRRPRLGSALVIGQVALSFAVLAAAGLFLRSLANATRIDPGFEPRNLALATFDLQLLGYDEARGRAFADELLRRVRALPGVAEAAVVDNVPLDTNWNTVGPLLKEGEPPPEAGQRGLRAELAVASPGSFRALGVPLQRGRDFDARDTGDAPSVLIVNETLAARLWPGEEAIGKQLRIGSADSPLREVIGVARDVKSRTLGEAPIPFLYRPLAQTWRGELTLLARGERGTAGLLEAMRHELAALDAGLPAYGLRTMEEHMGYALWWTRMGVTLASVFGALALLLAAVGLGGLMAYTVRQRTREIGVRIALGAAPADVRRLVLGRGLGLALGGLGAGLVTALALGPIMRSALYGVSAIEPTVLVAVSLLLGAAALLASWLPARRALRIEPMLALRSE